jgi:hypothetical protein
VEAKELARGEDYKLEHCSPDSLTWVLILIHARRRLKRERKRERLDGSYLVGLMQNGALSIDAAADAGSRISRVLALDKRTDRSIFEQQS